MSADLHIVQLQGLRRIYGVDMSPSGKLLLRGSRLSDAVGVRINGVTTETFTVLSPNLIEVDAPAGAVLHEVDVLTAATDGASGRMSFLLGRTPRKVQGLSKVVQQFVTLLLTTPGSDIFHPRRGGGLLSVLKGSLHPQHKETYTAPVMAAFTRAQRQMQADQVRLQLPPEERLASVSVTHVSFEPKSSAVSVSALFESAAGRQASAMLRVD